MLNNYLKEISLLSIELIGNPKKVEKNEKFFFIESVIFNHIFPNSLIDFKYEFLKNINEKKKLLLHLENNIKKDSIISHKDKLILQNEIFIKLKKIEFLSKIYDIEGNKLDNSYVIQEEVENYDFYNELFYNVSKKDLNDSFEIYENKNTDILFSKEELEYLLKKTQEYVGEFKYEFGNYMGFSCFKDTLKMPNSDLYNLRNIIVIFFHEMTHFFRYINGIKNLGFGYYFEDYTSIEEGITLYNEHFYGNQICNYGEYSPFYDICYKICLEDIPENEKKDKIYEILKNKGFSREKTDYYFYYRFYKYSKINGKNLFLKDLIYTKAYKVVKNLLKNDEKNYEKIMAGKIGLFELENNFVLPNKNLNSKEYFEFIMKEILLLIKNKNG